MSKDSDTPSSRKPAKPIGRFGTGTLSLLQILCVTILFVGINYLSSQYYAPKDLSADAAFTLSPATKRFLESPAVQERDEPIRVIVAFRRSNGFYDRVRALAEEYSRIAGKGKVKLELVDPIRSPDRTQQIKEAYRKVFGTAFNNRTMFTTDLVIIDARTKAERDAMVSSPNDPPKKSHIRFIESENMARFETDEKGQRKITGFVGEDAITTGLVAAIEGQPRKVYLFTDKTGYTVDTVDSPLSTFEGILLSQNALTVRAPISGLDRIPDDAAAVAIINPAYDFTPQELEVLGEYWNRPKSGVLVTLGQETPPRLRAFLRNLGITPGRDRVITAKGDQIISTVRGTFKGGMEFTKDFWDKVATFEGATNSLEIRDSDNEDLLNRKIMPYTLLETGPEFWGETRFGAATPAFDPREDNPGPSRLAGAVIRGGATRDDVGDSVSKMVVISNSDFLSPKYLTDINRNFMASSANWLIGREELTGFGPRTLGTYKLPLLDSQVSFINRVNLFFLPGFAFLIGLIVWSSRRA
ncbi:DUF7088 domain-containing protein [Luteolibacter luteus]|uniref:DUF7088 domain-containing protein n=1 Tax=Luteolibacter luteus TaxID=2728835 RepID=A0A858RDJ0_9BACT|nr:Gldg family protein [Luteolibacter luteus]QJE94459.1 hypothetical protein HHL09_01200 [Luteolibacter luteus]